MPSVGRGTAAVRRPGVSWRLAETHLWSEEGSSRDPVDRSGPPAFTSRSPTPPATPADGSDADAWLLADRKLGVAKARLAAVVALVVVLFVAGRASGMLVGFADDNLADPLAAPAFAQLHPDALRIFLYWTPGSPYVTAEDVALVEQAEVLAPRVFVTITGPYQTGSPPTTPEEIASYVAFASDLLTRTTVRDVGVWDRAESRRVLGCGTRPGRVRAPSCSDLRRDHAAGCSRLGIRDGTAGRDSGLHLGRRRRLPIFGQDGPALRVSHRPPTRSPASRGT